MAAINQPVVILGAGINGAALARELVLNRVPVCLVDTADIASGTTACSSRLIHGGLRYLEYGELDLVRESLAERTRLLRLAPQFVRPLRLFIPVQRRFGGLWQAMGRFFGRSGKASPRPAPRGIWLVRAGLALYDAYAKDPTLPGHATHSRGKDDMPAVDEAKYRWACSYWDGQVEYPERLVLAMLEDARRMAAEGRIWFSVYTYHRASLSGRTVEIHPSGGSSESPSTDAPPATRLEPAAIINATGAWGDRTLAQLEVPSRRLMGGTRGSHLLTGDRRLRELLAGRGVYVEAPDGRPVFLLPLGEATLVGTTDLPFDGDPGEVTASNEEIDYLLAAVHGVFPQVRLSRSDIDMHYCGVRPLPHVDNRSPGAITRRHWLEEHAEAAVPFYSVIGGKLTTCRSLAEEATGRLLKRLGLEKQADSRERVFPGGESYPQGDEQLAAEQRRVAEELGFSPQQIAAVWRLCGTQTADLLAPPPPEGWHGDGGIDNLTGTLLPHRFVRRVIRNEWVARLEDLVERRLMLLYHRGLSRRCLRQLAQLLVEEGVIGADEVDEQMRHCLDRWQQRFGRRLPETDARQP